jgi:hypothetical protein
MIRTITFIECDCCDARIELSTGDEDLAAHDARLHNWHVEMNRYPSRHYCPACKVPVKLAKAMEAAK